MIGTCFRETAPSAPGSHDHPLVLLNTAAFLETLPAFLPPDQASQQQLPDLLEILRAITTQVES
jgi:hypothetical protein